MLVSGRQGERESVETREQHHALIWLFAGCDVTEAGGWWRPAKILSWLLVANLSPGWLYGADWSQLKYFQIKKCDNSSAGQARAATERAQLGRIL